MSETKNIALQKHTAIVCFIMSVAEVFPEELDDRLLPPQVYVSESYWGRHKKRVRRIAGFAMDLDDSRSSVDGLLVELRKLVNGLRASKNSPDEGVEANPRLQ